MPQPFSRGGIDRLAQAEFGRDDVADAAVLQRGAGTARTGARCLIGYQAANTPVREPGDGRRPGRSARSENSSGSSYGGSIRTRPRLCLRRQQRPQRLPAVAMMHRDLAIVREQPAQRARSPRGAVRSRPDGRRGAAGPGQRRRAGIQAERAHQADIVGQRRRRPVEQSAMPSATRRCGAPDRCPGRSGRRRHGYPARTAAPACAAAPAAANQQRMLHAVGEVAGMEGVAVVHAAAAPPRPAASAAAARNPARRPARGAAARSRPRRPSPRCRCTAASAARPAESRAAAAAAASAARTAALAATPPATTSKPRTRRPRAHHRHGMRRRDPPAPRPPRAGSSRRYRPPSCVGNAPGRVPRDLLRHRGLQPGEAEVAAGPAQHRPRERVAPRVAAGRQRLQRRAARPAQTQQLGDLVERLAGRIVDRAAQPAVAPDALDRDALAMAAGDQQQQIGKRGAARRPGPAAARSAHAPPGGSPRRTAARARCAMPLANWLPTIRPPISPGPPLAATPPSSAKPTPARAITRLHQLRQKCQMRARGDFRHHAAIRRVLGLLAQHGLGQHVSGCVQHRRRGFVAGGLDAQHRAHRADPIPSLPRSTQ